MIFLHMVKFNYARLFKHWSAYVLYAMVILLVISLGLFPRLHHNAVQSFTVYADAQAMDTLKSLGSRWKEHNEAGTRYVLRQAEEQARLNINAESAYVSFLGAGPDTRVEVSYSNSSSRNLILEKSLADFFQEEFLENNGIVLPAVQIEPVYLDQHEEMPMVAQMVMIFAPYLFALLFGTMIFIAVSVESIEKISYLLLSKVTAFHILYSKVAAVLLFFAGLLAVGLIGAWILFMTGTVDAAEFIKGAHVNAAFAWRYGLVFIFGVLQIVMLFTLFALFIRESSQLQTGMMIPGIVTALGWGVGYWILLFKPDLSAYFFAIDSLQAVPIFNLFTTIAHLGNGSLTNSQLWIFLASSICWLIIAHFGLRAAYAANQKINL